MYLIRFWDGDGGAGRGGPDGGRGGGGGGVLKNCWELKNPYCRIFDIMTGTWHATLLYFTIIFMEERKVDHK